MLTENRKLKIMEKFISKQSINIFGRKWHIYFFLKLKNLIT